MKRDYLKVFVLFLLFVAVLFIAVNPKGEELKASDIETRKDAFTLKNALSVYKEITGISPWETEFYNDRKLDWIKVDKEWKTNNGEIILDKLVDDEGKYLSKSFANTISSEDYNSLMIYSLDFLDSEIYICFSPLSLPFQQEARYRCEANPPSDFPPIACDNIETAWYCIQ